MSAPRKYRRKKCRKRSLKAVQGQTGLYPCRAWAQAGTDYCWVHNPDGRAQKQIADTKQMNARGSLR